MWKGWTRSCEISEIVAKLYESLETHASIYVYVSFHATLSVSFGDYAIEPKAVIPTQYIYSFKLASLNYDR